MNELLICFGEPFIDLYISAISNFLPAIGIQSEPTSRKLPKIIACPAHEFPALAPGTYGLDHLAVCHGLVTGKARLSSVGAADNWKPRKPPVRMKQRQDHSSEAKFSQDLRAQFSRSMVEEMDESVNTLEPAKRWAAQQQSLREVAD